MDIQLHPYPSFLRPSLYPRVVASSSDSPMSRNRKRAAPKLPTLDDLKSVTDLGTFFDLLDLPNGPIKQVGDRSTISGEPVRKKPKSTKTARSVL